MLIKNVETMIGFDSNQRQGEFETFSNFASSSNRMSETSLAKGCGQIAWDHATTSILGSLTIKLFTMVGTNAVL